MWTIAEYTLRKLKEASFIIMLVLSCLMAMLFSDSGAISDEISGSLISPLFSGSQGSPVLTSSIYSFVIAAMIAIFIGATDIPRDIESRMIMLLLSKPISRRQYIWGKFLGTFLICVIFFVAAQISSLIFFYMNTGALHPPEVAARQLGLIVVLLPLVGLTVTISCFTADFSAMILSTIYLLFSVSISAIPVLLAMLPDSFSGLSYFMLLYYFFPNFVYFFRSFHSFGLISFGLVVYAMSLTCIFLSIATHRMETRDLI